MSDDAAGRNSLDQVCLFISARPPNKFPYEDIVLQACTAARFEVRALPHHYSGNQRTTWDATIAEIINAELVVFDLTPANHRAGNDTYPYLALEDTSKWQSCYDNNLVLEVGMRFMVGRPMIILLENSVDVLRSFSHLDPILYYPGVASAFRDLAAAFNRRLSDIARGRTDRILGDSSRPIFKTFRDKAVCIGNVAVTLDDLRRIESAQQAEANSQTSSQGTKESRYLSGSWIKRQ